MIQITGTVASSATKRDIGGAGGHSKKLECKLEAGVNNGFKRNQSAGAHTRLVPN